MEIVKEDRIVIVGAGFAGIRAALDLARNNLSNVKIVLITNKHHFEYYPRIYQVVTGASPLEVCVRLQDVFAGKNVEIIIDEIVEVNHNDHFVKSENGTVYTYSKLILALGSETTYFGIEGLAERAFGFKSVKEALKLKLHLHRIFDVYLSAKKEDLLAQLHIVIVGGGPSGVELAGVLNNYMKTLSSQHSIDNKFVTIDLIEASTRLVPSLPEEVSEKIYHKLHSLGINIFLNRTLIKEDVDNITMKDMSLRSNTLIWTAGSKINHFYSTIPNIQLNKNGRVLVGEYLDAVGMKDVYILGDAANTTYAGLAQTAIYDGEYIAKYLNDIYTNQKPNVYKPKKIAYVVPIGRNWAAMSLGPFTLYGFKAAVFRDFIDFKFFLSILPFRTVMRIFCGKKNVYAYCGTCNELGKEK